MGQVRHGRATYYYPAGSFLKEKMQRGHAGGQSSNTAIAVFDLGAEPGAWGVRRFRKRSGGSFSRRTPKTMAKWRKRLTVEDRKTGPSEPRSTVLSEDEEAMVVAFRRHKLPPLNDRLYALEPLIPHLTRSSLHRCLQRHRISRLPDVEGDKPKRQKFKRYPIGYFHMDIAKVRTEEGKLYLFVAIDRTSKFAVAQLVDKANRKTAWEFLEHLLEAVPYQIHTILTDNHCPTGDLQRKSAERGIHSAEQPRNRDSVTFRKMRFDLICEASGIEHRHTKPNHPWSSEDQKTVQGPVFPRDGQVERMNRTIKEATVKRYHYESHDQLRSHLSDVLDAYNFARRLKTLSGLTQDEYICKIWTSEPHRFILSPIHQMPGLNSWGVDLLTAM